MTPRKMQDITPPSRRSIRDISMPGRPDTKKPGRSFGSDRSPGSKRFQANRWFWVIGIVALILIIFVVFSLFSGSDVTITPRTESVTLSHNITAMRSAAPDELSYRTVSLSRDAGQVVEATEEEEVEQKASGNIVIYNNFSSKEQKLINRTRFESPKGLIFRIDKSITVPGTTVEGGAIVPGSIEVVVYADEVGTKYNVGLTDFTIPGFKSDAERFKGFYARSKTEIKDGFSGTAKKVSPEDSAATRAAIQGNIRSELLGDIRSQIPDNFVFFEDGAAFTFEPLAQSNTTDTSVQLNERGTIRGVMFEKDQLATYLAELALPNVKDDIMIDNVALINLKVVDKSVLEDEANESIDLIVSGGSTAIWQIDDKSIKKDLAGAKKKNINVILAQYPGIERAQAVVRPFWKSSFPKNPSDIKIVIDLESSRE